MTTASLVRLFGRSRPTTWEIDACFVRSVNDTPTVMTTASLIRLYKCLDDQPRLLFARSASHNGHE